MYVITFEAVQDEDNHDYDDKIGGAFVVIYRNCSNEIEGMEYCSRFITQLGWIPINIQNSGLICPDEFTEDDEYYDIIQQAKVDGYAYIIHEWPKEQLE